MRPAALALSAALHGAALAALTAAPVPRAALEVAPALTVALVASGAGAPATTDAADLSASVMADAGPPPAEDDGRPPAAPVPPARFVAAPEVDATPPARPQAPPEGDAAAPSAEAPPKTEAEAPLATPAVTRELTPVNPVAAAADAAAAGRAAPAPAPRPAGLAAAARRRATTVAARPAVSDLAPAPATSPRAAAADQPDDGDGRATDVAPGGGAADGASATADGASAAEGEAMAAWAAEVRRRIERAKRFPRAARARGETGVARLRVVLAPDGALIEAAIEASSGHAALDEATLAAAAAAAPFPPAPGALRGSRFAFVAPVRYAP